MDIHNLTPQEIKEQKQIYLQMDFPYSYSISLGEWKCNRICKMCPMYNKPPLRDRYITREVFERACSEAGDRKVSMEISAYGETFQHPEADKLIATARRMCPNANIVVATNGTLLDEERCRRIVDSGIDHLSFSLDAGSPESYEWLTKATGEEYRKVCNNLERLVEIRNKKTAKHLAITCHIIGINELSHEFDSFLKRWSGIVDNAYVRNYGNWAGLVDNNGVTPAEQQRIPKERYPCAWLWYATKIEPNGDVSKCFIHVTGDKDPLGNIMSESFEVIWKGNKIKRLRALQCENRYNEMEFCDNCMVWSLFPNFWRRKKIFGIYNGKGWS